MKFQWKYNFYTRKLISNVWKMAVILSQRQHVKLKYVSWLTHSILHFTLCVFLPFLWLYMHSQHIEAETKWLSFCKQHFQVNFLVWKLLNIHSIFIEISSPGCDYPYANIDSDNGLAPNRRQAIIWTYYGLVYLVSISRHKIQPSEQI